MIKLQKPTDADVVLVLAHLWAPGKEEMAEFDLDFHALLSRVFDNLEHPSICVRVDDKPVVVAGMAPAGQGYSSWFLATDLFYLHAAGITMALRRHIKREWRRHGKPPMMIVSGARDQERAARWFGSLGFAPDATFAQVGHAGGRLGRYEYKGV